MGYAEENNGLKVDNAQLQTSNVRLIQERDESQMERDESRMEEEEIRNKRDALQKHLYQLQRLVADKSCKCQRADDDKANAEVKADVGSSCSKKCQRTH